MKKLLLALALLPLLALADVEKIGDVTWTFTVADREATVTKAEPSSGALEIPSTLYGLPVTGIGDYAFAQCGGLTSVTIPSGVTSVGKGAFWYCSGLTTVSMTSGVTNVG